MLDSMSPFAREIMQKRYAHAGESWRDVAYRVAGTVLGVHPLAAKLAPEVAELIEQRKFMPGGRYLYAAGRPFHQTQNCLLMRAEDTRLGWGDHIKHATLALMTGAGIGCNYSALRPEGRALKNGGGEASGPIALMQFTNEGGRAARQGGSRRGAIWAGLSWKHEDVFKFIAAKNWSAEVTAAKAIDFNAPGPLDYTNISVCLDDDFFDAYDTPSHVMHGRAFAVYWAVVRSMLETGEPGFSVDIRENAGEDLRNACTEITSADDSDICNLGSINLARIDTLAEMQRVVSLGTAFLLAGTLYSDLPYAKVADVRARNRRLGLGLMGVHEWLLKRGKTYGPDSLLAAHLGVYMSSDVAAACYARAWGISRPLKTRAIAPTGTIGIVAETTTGIEPIYAAAYRRRYRDGANGWKAQLYCDPTARRLVEQGVEPEQIEDALSLAGDVERRVAFQAWAQQFVDHGISSTINLPPWGTELNNVHTARSFGDMLIRYLPRLRGITVYPDGARGGQPLTRVDYREAAAHVGEVFDESVDVCDLRSGTSCGA
jgi:ribonucleoside-diphosphate reductase alpha chain